MDQLRRKLHSQTGASMMLALLFLFFCVTVGAVVLTAASANAGRLGRNAQEQKSYLAVESAALLLRDDLADMKLEGRFDHEVIEVETVEDDGSITVTTTEEYREGDVKLTQTPLNVLGGLERDLEDLFFSSCGRFPSHAAPVQMEYQLTFAAERDIPEVKAAVTISMESDSRYVITAVLKTTDGSNPMTLRFAAKTPVESRSTPAVASSGNRTITTVTHTWTFGWLPPKITKGEVTPP